LEYVNGEARRRYDAGLSYYDAATEISLDPYMDWIDSERIVINVARFDERMDAKLASR